MLLYYGPGNDEFEVSQDHCDEYHLAGVPQIGRPAMPASSCSARRKHTHEGREWLDYNHRQHMLPWCRLDQLHSPSAAATATAQETGGSNLSQ